MKKTLLPSEIRLRLPQHEPDYLQAQLDACIASVAALQAVEVPEGPDATLNAAQKAKAIAEAETAVEDARKALLETYPVFLAVPLDPHARTRFTAELTVAMTEEREVLAPRPQLLDGEGKPLSTPMTGRPLTKAEKIDRAAAESEIYLRMFAERVKRIEHFEFEGGIQYNAADAQHRASIDYEWQVVIATMLLAGARMSEIDQGKSSSPSASA